MSEKRADKPVAAGPSFRYERKFVPTTISRRQIESSLRLHPASFREIYHPRCVNNIYFDTPSLGNYRDNVDGLSRKLKVRIRWYGDPIGEVNRPKLEIKERVGQLGTKHAARLRGFSVQSGMTANDVISRLRETDELAEFSAYLSTVRPVLLNHYTRRYWMSRDGCFRVTLDWGIRFYRMLGRRYDFSYATHDSGKVILELKYQREMDPDAERVSRYFPCRLNKSSKYVTGVNLLYNSLSGISID
jgi:hypothetical protein